MAIESAEPSTALITNDIVLFGLIAATLGVIFWLASGPTPFWKKFFAWVPALLLCYFVPALYNTLGLIDGQNSALYNPVASRILLPAALVLLTLSMGLVTEELWFSEWENGGTVWDVPKNYEKFNPARHVGKWTTPTLIVAGQNDFRVPIDQSLSAFTALQRRGIDSKLLYFPDENHWVLKPQNSVQWHDTVNGWLKQHIGQ